MQKKFLKGFGKSFFPKSFPEIIKMTKIAVLVSGGGTNLQALIDAEKRGELGNGKITLV